MKWLSERDLAAPGTRLFCLPHAGSGTAGFHRWKRMLPASIAVCPVMLPGRETRLAEPSLLQVGAIVDALQQEAAAELQRPFAIFGHSMGALLAYEWARRIEAAGMRAPVCLFVSGRNAPQFAVEHHALHTLEEKELVRELGARYGGAPEALMEDAELREIFLPILRADLTVVETYKYRAGAKLKCPVMAFAGERDSSVSEDGLYAWKDIASSEFTSQRFVGDHFYPFGEGQAELLKTIEQQLMSA